MFRKLPFALSEAFRVYIPACEAKQFRHSGIEISRPNAARINAKKPWALSVAAIPIIRLEG